MTPRKWMSDTFCAESKEVQHISIGHDSGGEQRILLQKSSSPEGGICCFQAENHVCYTIYDARSPHGESDLGEICCDILDILKSKAQ